MSDSAKIVLSAENLSREFKDGSRSVAVLQNINFSVQAGETLSIVGASGSGKSTFLHLLGGLDKPTSGSVTLMGQRLDKLSEVAKAKLRNKYLGFVYQFHHLLPEFTTLENVQMPLLLAKLNRREAEDRAADILKKVGLSGHLQQRVTDLSGGERQRVAIARALVTNPACVLADEPTGNLDAKNADAVFELLLELNSSIQAALVVVTHDQSLAKRFGRVFAM